jgi:hypothetical protein
MFFLVEKTNYLEVKVDQQNMQFADITFAHSTPERVALFQKLGQALNRHPKVLCFSPQNTQGVLYWLGQNKGQNIFYTNPYFLGLVNVSIFVNGENILDKKIDYLHEALYQYGYPSSAQQERKVERVIDHYDSYSVKSEAPHDVRFIIDLGPSNILVNLSAYSMSSPNGDHDFYQNWQVLGSYTGREWVVIDERRRDYTLRGKTRGTWSVSKKGAFRYFCIKRNGGVAGSQVKNNVSMVELYGVVYQV